MKGIFAGRVLKPLAWIDMMSSCIVIGELGSCPCLSVEKPEDDRAGRGTSDLIGVCSVSVSWPLLDLFPLLASISIAVPASQQPWPR